MKSCLCSYIRSYVNLWNTHQVTYRLWLIRKVGRLPKGRTSQLEDFLCFLRLWFCRWFVLSRLWFCLGKIKSRKLPVSFVPLSFVPRKLVPSVLASSSARAIFGYYVGIPKRELVGRGCPSPFFANVPATAQIAISGYGGTSQKTTKDTHSLLCW